MPVLQSSSRLGQSDYLSVGRRVLKLLSLIIRLGNYRVLVYDNGTDRYIAVFLGYPGGVDCDANKTLIFFTATHRSIINYQ
jgi:hypothetical protein